MTGTRRCATSTEATLWSVYLRSGKQGNAGSVHPMRWLGRGRGMQGEGGTKVEWGGARGESSLGRGWNQAPELGL